MTSTLRKLKATPKETKAPKSQIKRHLSVVKKLFDYQELMIERLNKVYNLHKDKRAFLQMPTGSGKTFTALTFCTQQLTGPSEKTIVWVCHQTLLKDQSAQDFKEDFENQGGEVEVSKKPRRDGTNDLEIKSGKIRNITFLFKTWQTFRNEISEINADMLVIDEVHYGSSMNEGLGKKADHISFHKIIHNANIPIHLYVSATPWELNPSLFPGMITNGKIHADRIALFTLSEARNQNPPCIAEVEFRALHSADTLKIKEEETNDEDVIDGEDSEELADKARTRKVNLKDARSQHALRKSTAYTLIDAAMQEETANGTKPMPPTIVFCRSVSDVHDPLSIRNMLKLIKTKATAIFGTDYDTGRALVSSVHGMSPDKAETISDFKAGKIKILLVCQMAREGFNYPELEVAIDLCPSLNNKRQIAQKIGRIIRYIPGKVARYYYADTIENYVKVSGVKHEISEIQKDKMKAKILETTAYSNDDELDSIVSTLATAALKMADLNKSETGNDDPEFLVNYNGTTTINVNSDETSNIELKGNGTKKAYITKISYIITEAENNKKRSEKSFLSDMIARKYDRLPPMEIGPDNVDFMINTGTIDPRIFVA